MEPDFPFEMTSCLDAILAQNLFQTLLAYAYLLENWFEKDLFVELIVAHFDAILIIQGGCWWQCWWHVSVGNLLVKYLTNIYI